MGSKNKLKEWKRKTYKDWKAGTSKERARKKTGVKTLGLKRQGLWGLPSIFHETDLQTLDLSHNELAGLPEEIGQLAALQDLNLEGNRLVELPEEIGHLGMLRVLNLSRNQLAELPVTLRDLVHLEELYLEDNHALGIPPEVLGSARRPANPSDIIDYYFKSREEDSSPLLEAKILILGQGAVGKTSLVKRIIHNTFDREEPKTDGIDIAFWQIPGRQDQRIRVNIWDFGGQEIMHATHQFFLTKRSLYLVVLDARKDESDIFYWLRIIESFGGDSPVLVVVNKVDGTNRLDLNEYRLRKDFPAIRGFYRTSCLEGTGIDVLKRDISREIQNIEHVYNVVPNTFLSTKADLEAETESRDFLELREYREICQKNEVEERKEQDLLLRFLHDLGSVLHFADPKSPYQLEKTKILNPQWVTRGVYRILNDRPLAESGGVLELTDIERILTRESGYPEQGRRFILGMMHKFELCFQLTDGTHRYLVPELLPKSEPALDLDKEDALRFEYHYEHLPDGVLPRFIVRMHPHFTTNSVRWRSGLLVEVDGNRVLVRGDTQVGRVFVSVLDSPAGRRRALAVIRATFRAIHQTFPGNLGKEMIPLSEDPGLAVGYQHLLRLEAAQKESYWPEEAMHEYSVSMLLDGIETLAQRDKLRESLQIEHVGTLVISEGQTTIDNRKQLVQIAVGDLPKLAEELAELRQKLASRASEPKHFHQLAKISEVEKAAEAGDAPKTARGLKRIGKWAYSEAKEITTGILASTLTNLARGT